MKIQKSILKITSKDDARRETLRHVCVRKLMAPSIEGLCRNPDNVYAVATDGKRLVAVPVELDAEQGEQVGMVSAEAIEAAGRIKGPWKGDMHANGSVQVLVGNSMVGFPRPDVTYPNCQQVVPHVGIGTHEKVGINAAYLAELACAMGSKGGIVLHIHKNENGVIDDKSPIVVTPNDDDVYAGSWALLMPMVID